jgi:putative transposase
MRGWYSRGYLPHYDEPGKVQFITYRLHDSLPKAVLDAWDEAMFNKECDELEHMRKIERYLDKGHGACWLRHPAVAEMIQDNLRHFDGQRYHLLAWCVMSNHVHVIIETVEGYSLESVTHSWKSYSSHQLNRILDRQGAVWQPEVFDLFMRGPVHLARVIFYVEQNPVTANLVAEAEEWLYSSARYRRDMEPYNAHRL